MVKEFKKFENIDKESIDASIALGERCFIKKPPLLLIAIILWDCESGVIL